MAQKRTVDYQNRKVEGEVIDFEAVPENWTYYKLADGTTLKMRLSLLEVVRLLNEYNPQTGEPVYVFSAQNIITLDAPENLKKKA